jgi:cell division control protein 6
MENTDAGLDERGDNAKLTTEEGSINDLFLEDRDTVFRDESLLHPTNIVDEDRIVGRDEQLEQVISLLKPALNGSPPKDMVLHGHSGTGKSLIIRKVLDVFADMGDQYDKQFGGVYINCKDCKSEDSAVWTIASKVADAAGVELELPKRGITTKAKYDRLFELVGGNFDCMVIILDELDRLKGRNRNRQQPHAYSDLLYNLTRATDIADLDHQITTAVLTNDGDSLIDGIDTRAKSSFTPRRVLFDDYDATQLRSILEKREDAFRDGAVSDDVIPLTAAHAAQGEGDARKAIDLLHSSGEVADEKGAPIIEEEHTREAIERLDSKYYVEEVINASNHKQITIFAATICGKVKDDEIEGAPGGVVHDIYVELCNILDHDPRGRQQTRNWLNEYETNSLFSDKQTNFWGQGSGTHKHYHFRPDPRKVRNAIADSHENLEQALSENKERLESKVRTQYARLKS